jgi:ribulose-phosphate 3-epimerase
MSRIKVAPSMMCADFLNLGKQIEVMEASGIDYFHVDIMDGHNVPNFTLGPDFCRRLAESTSIPLDIHPLQLIRSCGARPGIAVDPSMTIDAVRPLLPYVELVCVMTVNPGYAGQKLIPQMIDKIKELAGTLTEERLEIEIEVDGNVSWQNIPRMVEAGAQILVAGSSSLFEAASELEANIERLHELIGRG